MEARGKGRARPHSTGRARPHTTDCRLQMPSATASAAPLLTPHPIPLQTLAAAGAPGRARQRGGGIPGGAVPPRRHLCQDHGAQCAGAAGGQGVAVAESAPQACHIQHDQGGVPGGGAADQGAHTGVWCVCGGRECRGGGSSLFLPARRALQVSLALAFRSPHPVRCPPVALPAVGRCVPAGAQPAL